MHVLPELAPVGPRSGARRYTEEEIQRNHAAKRAKYAAIRRDAGNGMSRRAIERKHHVGRRTIVKALASADPPERKKFHREPAALDGLHGHIGAMIAANPQVTIAAIWERLADENGVTVAYPTLRTYVSNRRDPTGHSLPVMDANPADLVRSGYNAISHRYRSDDDAAHEYDRWLADLRDRLPGRGQILDIGCGCGVPVARHLTAAGHQVTGVDISDVQIERARRLVPGATFIRADATELDFPPGSFDAVVCLYALIHMPLDRQPRLLHNIARRLRPGGWLLATTGQDAWTGTQDNWLGGPATMWWSQADAATYRSWIHQAGLEVTRQQFVPEGDSGHALFWARQPSTSSPRQPKAYSKESSPDSSG